MPSGESEAAAGGAQRRWGARVYALGTERKAEADAEAEDAESKVDEHTGEAVQK